MRACRLLGAFAVGVKKYGKNTVGGSHQHLDDLSRYLLLRRISICQHDLNDNDLYRRRVSPLRLSIYWWSIFGDLHLPSGVNVAGSVESLLLTLWNILGRSRVESCVTGAFQ
jgi:hypothetical protein